jgi:gamma-glutamyltranspeptidase
MHMQWLPDVVYAERATFDAATVARFRAAGYRLRFGPAGSAANGVAIRPDGMRVGAHDPRVPTGSARAF